MEHHGKLRPKYGKRGLESTAISLFSAAFQWSFHTRDRYIPIKAADEKVPLSVVYVNKKPQHIVFCLRLGHQTSKQRSLAVESSKRPCGAQS
jgi:hypothetical protein